MKNTDDRFDLPQGTLDLLIMRVVALGPIHGYAIAQRIQQISRSEEHTSELQSRTKISYAGANLVGDLKFEVEAQLFVQIGLQSFAREKSP